LPKGLRQLRHLRWTLSLPLHPLTSTLLTPFHSTMGNAVISDVLGAGSSWRGYWDGAKRPTAGWLERRLAGYYTVRMVRRAVATAWFRDYAPTIYPKTEDCLFDDMTDYLDGAHHIFMSRDLAVDYRARIGGHLFEWSSLRTYLLHNMTRYWTAQTLKVGADFKWQRKNCVTNEPCVDRLLRTSSGGEGLFAVFNGEQIAAVFERLDKNHHNSLPFGAKVVVLEGLKWQIKGTRMDNSFIGARSDAVRMDNS